MDLQKMQQIQKELDDRIIKEKNIKLSQNELLMNTFVALDVELSEMANEHQWFKVWKGNNRPKDGLLTEFVDCLHFFLSIANQRAFNLETEDIEDYLPESLSNAYLDIKSCIIDTYSWIDTKLDNTEEEIIRAFSLFLYIGLKHFNFTLEQIESEYYRKNKINHDRQNKGY